ncbi:MAG: ABC transporter substrate-binding protein [Candidatus Thermoplasmatota archaeon]
MNRILTVAITCMMATIALAGCTGNNTPTTPTGGTGGLSSAIATASPMTPAVNQPVNFDGSGSGTNAKTMTWVFGDGANGTGTTVSHAYAAPGHYIVRLSASDGSKTVTNDADLLYLMVLPAVSITGSTNATNIPPVADITTSAAVLQAGGSTTANGTGSYGWTANPDYNSTVGPTPDNQPVAKDYAGISEYSWDFGDGSAIVTGNATVAGGVIHTYANPGAFPLKLTVTSGNSSSSAVGTIVVLSTPPTVGGFKSKDTFVTATISGPQSFDPGFDYETAGGTVIEATYDRLFTYDHGDTAKPVGQLAANVPTLANGEVKNNGLRYEIPLRTDAKFQDGTTVDAAAVKFSLDRLILMGDPSSAALPVLAPIVKGGVEYLTKGNAHYLDRTWYLDQKGIEVIDATHVAINLPGPDPSVVARLAFAATSIVSPTAVKAAHSERSPLWGVASTVDGLPPAGKATRDPWMDANTAGSGPYKLRQWLPNDRVILDRNDAWTGARPAMKTVIIWYVDDLNTRILLLKNGDADDIYVPVSDIARVTPTISSVAHIVNSQTLTIGAGFFTYNVSDPNECPQVAGASDCTMFADQKVREFFVKSFDYTDFLGNVSKGNNLPIAGVIPRGLAGYDENLPAYQTDVTAAKAALAASHIAGKEVTVDVSWNTGNKVREGAANILKRTVESASDGKVHINLKPLKFNDLLTNTQHQGVAMWFLGWAPDYIATDDYIKPFLQTGGNYPFNQAFSDAAIDAAIDKAVGMTDPAAQANAWKEINKMAVDKYVDLFLYQGKQVHVERSYVTGYYFSAMHSGQPNVGDYTTVGKA